MFLYIFGALYHKREYFVPSSYQIALTLAYISHIELHGIFNVLTLDMLFLGHMKRLENLIFSSLTSDICAIYIFRWRETICYSSRHNCYVDSLLCVDNIGEKRLTDKTFIPKKCDDIKWKLFDSFFFVVSIIRKFNLKKL